MKKIDDVLLAVGFGLLNFALAAVGLVLSVLMAGLLFALFLIPFGWLWNLVFG